METQAQEQTQARILTAEEKNDLRRRVLMGESLTIEQARDVIASCRAGHVSAFAASESSEKKSRSGSRAKKQALSDEELDASLSSLGL